MVINPKAAINLFVNIMLISQIHSNVELSLSSIINMLRINHLESINI